MVYCAIFSELGYRYREKDTCFWSEYKNAEIRSNIKYTSWPCNCQPRGYSICRWVPI